MYSVYHTEGIILSSHHKGEASTYLYIFTKEFGLVGANAQGIRELKSKLRYHLQYLSRIHVELVNGKTGWRVVNAMGGPYYGNFELESRKEAHAVFARFAALLTRLLGGEEKNEGLYETVSAFHDILTKEDFTSDELSNIETVGVMRILNLLGYWGESNVPLELLSGAIKEPGFFHTVSPMRRLVVREINKALRETQM